MSYYDEIKKELDESPEIKAEFDALDVPPFDEYFAKNNHLLIKSEKKRKKQLSHSKNNDRNKSMETPDDQKYANRDKKQQRFSLFNTKQIALIITSFVLIVGLGLGLGLYYGLLPDPIRYTYEDEYITAKECSEYDLTRIEGLFLPDLNLLSEKTFSVGEHNESLETIYYRIQGIYDDGIHYRIVMLYIILKAEYTLSEEEQYKTENKVSVDKYNISIFNGGFDDPLYRYKLGFNYGGVRYYINYETIDENDYTDFLTEFLI